MQFVRQNFVIHTKQGNYLSSTEGACNMCDYMCTKTDEKSITLARTKSDKNVISTSLRQ